MELEHGRFPVLPCNLHERGEAGSPDAPDRPKAGNFGPRARDALAQVRRLRHSKCGTRGSRPSDIEKGAGTLCLPFFSLHGFATLIISPHHHG